ncbi:uncharacterized protein LOC108907720 [Anoplophora glabripennis]|uniref:uncharacterized protein LOC108907720 n=1 Tax=Anoplophora glabripennis TaxID=217634 RepID=UPI000874E1EF|nr:uncharacterized protein LOC108907720 [Anoplophora glabripennis]
MASLYTMQAVKKGYIGLSFSNGVPQLVPPGGLEVALGANPLSIAAPAHCDFLVVDMSTTAVTFAKIKKYADKRADLPKGWALNKKGEVEQDPDKAMIFKKLCPLGAEQSHKGFGLALLVEVLSGVLADSNYGSKIPNTLGKCKCEPLNLGHGFIAINPEKFVPNFATRLSKLLNQLRDMESAECTKSILVPGDRERMHMKKVDSEGGIRYSRDQLEVLETLSRKLCVPFLEISVSLAQVRQNKKKS